MSDGKVDDISELLIVKGEYKKEPSWPYFIWIVFLSMLLITIMLWGVSILFDAPLEGEAAWAKTPNPAKAPWYFIGLQELLVYFDPWIAGVLLPGQILVGLILIPYVDISPHAQGYFGFKDRKFAVSFFTFGMFLWFSFILIGQFFRGPSWEFYWPYFDYPIGGHSWTYPDQPLKVTTAKLVSMSNTAGISFILAFGAIGMLAPIVLARSAGSFKIATMMKDYIDKLGPIRYFIVQSHVVMTMFIVAKIFLRLVFDIKYVLVTPWFNV